MAANTVSGADIPTPSDIVIMGQVVGVFGTRGWLKVHSYTRPRGNLFTYRDWWLGRPGHWTQFGVAGHKQTSTALLVAFEGVTDRDAATPLVHDLIGIPREALPPPALDEYYWSDLIGTTVVNLQGVTLGQVRALTEAGDHDVLIIGGAREYLVPFVRRRYIVEVDLLRRVITVDWHVDD
jgi:16S rRNA processing protein RimM